MYATVSTSPERASCITQGTSPRSSKRTFAASLAVCTTIARLYEPPAWAPEGAASAPSSDPIGFDALHGKATVRIKGCLTTTNQHGPSAGGESTAPRPTRLLRQPGGF